MMDEPKASQFLKQFRWRDNRFFLCRQAFNVVLTLVQWKDSPSSGTSRNILKMSFALKSEICTLPHWCRVIFNWVRITEDQYNETSVKHIYLGKDEDNLRMSPLD